MAIDKAIDSVKLESNLTSIADAIREKGGTSEQLAFPAGFVSAIGAISAGGGGLKMASGTFQVEENTDVTYPNYYQVSHNLGVQPDLIVLMPDTHYPTGDSDVLFSMILERQGTVSYRQNIGVGGTTKYNFWNNKEDLKTDENTFIFCILGRSSATKLTSAFGYKWFVFEFE